MDNNNSYDESLIGFYDINGIKFKYNLLNGNILH